MVHFVPSTFGIAIAVFLDILLAITSSPIFSESPLNFFLVEISFTNATDGTAVIQTGNSSLFNGTVNSVDVLSLADITLSLWSACYDQIQNGIDNITCLTTFIGPGYSVVIQNANSTTGPITLVQSWWTRPLYIHFLAVGVKAIGMFTKRRPKYVWVVWAAIALTIIQAIIEYSLFSSVKKVVPVLGSQVQTFLGPGFYLTVGSALALFLALLAHYVE